MKDIKIKASKVLSLSAIIEDEHYFARYAQDPSKIVRGNEEMPKDQDDYINARENARTNRIAKETSDALVSAFERPDINRMVSRSLHDHARQNNKFDILTEISPVEGRINASYYGEAYASQLNSVVPFLFVQPIRGVSFDFLPRISQGGIAGETIEVQAYQGAQGTFVPYAENVTEYSTVEVEGITNKVLINRFTKSLTFGVKENAAVAEYSAMSKYDNYNPNIGFMNPIVAKVDYLNKYYKLTHDNIAWLGTYDTAGNPAKLGFTNVVTTQDINQVEAPSGNFSQLTSYDQANAIIDLANTVYRQSLTTLITDTIFIDSNSFTQLTKGYGQYKDTVALQNILASGMVKAIIPVPAWSVAYPTKTTIIAANNSVSTWFYNLAMPLTAFNPDLKGFEITIPYGTGTSGVTINNRLGLARLVMNY
jgi:hypothetical protein